MFNRREVTACLRAALLPVPQSKRDPVIKSRNIKDAIKRLGCEADELQEVAEGKPPFCQTIKSLVERM